METKIKWSKTAKEIVLQVKFPREIFDLDPKMSKSNDFGDYLRNISDQMSKFFNLNFANGFLITNNCSLSFGKDKVPTLKVEVGL